MEPESATGPGPYYLLAKVGLFLLVFVAAAQLFRWAGYAYPEVKHPAPREGDRFYIATDGFAYDHIRYLYEDDGPARSAAGADVLFLGSSRVMLGVSRAAVAQELGPGIKPHWMGFMAEGHAFSELVMKQHGDFHPKLVIVNAESTFFESNVSEFGRIYVRKGQRTALSDMRNTARMNSEWRVFQRIAPIPQINTLSWKLEHTRLPLMWRSMQEGDWVIGNWESSAWTHEKIAQPANEALPANFAEQLGAAREFVQYLRARGAQVLFISVPSPGGGEIMAREVGRELNVTTITVPWDDYYSFDGSHLDEPSAYRYTKKIFEEIKKTEEWRALEQ